MQGNLPRLLLCQREARRRRLSAPLTGLKARKTRFGKRSTAWPAGSVDDRDGRSKASAARLSKPPRPELLNLIIEYAKLSCARASSPLKWRTQMRIRSSWRLRPSRSPAAAPIRTSMPGRRRPPRSSRSLRGDQSLQSRQLRAEQHRARRRPLSAGRATKGRRLSLPYGLTRQSRALDRAAAGKTRLGKRSTAPTADPSSRHSQGRPGRRNRAAERTRLLQPTSDGVIDVAGGFLARVAVGHATWKVGDGRDEASAVFFRQRLNHDRVVRLFHFRPSPRR